MERGDFIAALRAGEENLSELCQRFGISRKTGYMWKKRYEEGGPAGLENRQPFAHHHPDATAPEVEDRLVQVRKAYPTWVRRTCEGGCCSTSRSWWCRRRAR